MAIMTSQPCDLKNARNTMSLRCKCYTSIKKTQINRLYYTYRQREKREESASHYMHLYFARNRQSRNKQKNKSRYIHSICSWKYQRI